MSQEQEALLRWTATARRLCSETARDRTRCEQLKSSYCTLVHSSLLSALMRQRRASNDHNPLIALPRRVLCQIFDEEPCRNVALQLCHRLRRCILDTPALWTTLTLDATMTPRRAHELLQRSHSLPLQDVQLECHAAMDLPAVDLEALYESIGAHIHRVCNLSLTLPYPNAVPWPAAPLLEWVALGFHARPEGPLDIGAMFPDAPRLTCMTVQRVGMSTFIKAISPPSRSLFLRLQTLELVGGGAPWIRTTQRLDDILVSLPNLETFRGLVIGFGEHTLLAPAAFRSVSPNLTVLRIGKCRTPRNIVSLCVALGGVRALIFESGRVIENGLLIGIVDMFPRVTAISLGCALGEIKAISTRDHAIQVLINTTPMFGWYDNVFGPPMWSTHPLVHLTSLSLHEFFWRPEFWTELEMPYLMRVRIILASCWNYRQLRLKSWSHNGLSMFCPGSTSAPDSSEPTTKVDHCHFPSLRELHISFHLSSDCSATVKEDCSCRPVSSLALSDVSAFVVRHLGETKREDARLRLTGVEVVDIDPIPYLQDLYRVFTDIIISASSEPGVGDEALDVWQVAPRQPNDQLSVFHYVT